MRKSIFLLSFLCICILALYACGSKKETQMEKGNMSADAADTSVVNNEAATSSGDNDNSSGDCDPSLWKAVYNPERLTVTKKCKVVTGVIEETNADDDGDQHMLLKLDKGQENLLTDRNIKKKQGDLVIEAVCINNISKKKVGNACDGYVNHVKLPNVGDHVKVTGSLVIDSHNGWAEIHPITRIDLIK